jgi:hypothetical protein
MSRGEPRTAGPGVGDLGRSTARASSSSGRPAIRPTVGARLFPALHDAGLVSIAVVHPHPALAALLDPATRTCPASAPFPRPCLGAPEAVRGTATAEIGVDLGVEGPLEHPPSTLAGELLKRLAEGRLTRRNERLRSAGRLDAWPRAVPREQRATIARAAGAWSSERSGVAHAADHSPRCDRQSIRVVYGRTRRVPDRVDARRLRLHGTQLGLGAD